MTDKNDENVMIDVETLSKSNNALITAIAAVRFNPYTGMIDEKNAFYQKINWTSVKEYIKNFDIDPGTVSFWLKQDDSSRKGIIPVNGSSALLNHSLRDLFVWCSDIKELHKSDIRPWGNGSVFDIPILEHAYKVYGIPIPWKFYNIRDVRTIVDLGENLVNFDRRNTKFKGTKHNALHDAIHQSRYVIDIIKTVQGFMFRKK